MAKIDVIQQSFTSGELSDQLLARNDLTQYKSSAKSLENLMVLPHGSVIRRPGTVVTGEVRNSAEAAREVPFVFSKTLSFLIVFNDNYIQFVKEGSFVETTPPTRYEIASPYTEAQLPELKYAQSGNIVFISHPSHPPKQLVRTTDTDWAITDIPFKDYALTGQWYRSAYLDFKLLDGTTDYIVGDYWTITTDGAGAITSNVFTGTGNGDMYGETVDTTLDAVGIITWKVECIFVDGDRQEWSITRDPGGGNELTPVAQFYPGNYPNAVGFHEQRLWLGGTNDDPQRLWCSETGIYTNLTRGTDAADGFYVSVAADSLDEILHITSGSELLVFTYGSEFTVSGTSDSGITPTSYKIKTHTNHGSNSMKPLRIGSSVLFAQRDGLKIRTVAYDASGTDSAAPDITILAEHITESGLKESSFQQSPYYTGWIVKENGDLLSLVYIIEQGIVAWARHTTDGLYESIATIPEGTDAVTYTIVNRTINGATVRYVEYFDYELDTDCTSVQTAGSPTTAFTGLDHLEGETIDIVADGKHHPNKTVTSGAVTLDYDATNVEFGMHFESYLILQHPEPVAETSTRASKVRMIKASILLKDTVNVSVAFLDVNGNEISSYDIPTFLGGDEMDAAPTPFTGIKDITGQGWRVPHYLKIKQTTPMPITILGVIMKLEVNQ